MTSTLLAPDGHWLFGKSADLLTFGGSAVVAVGLASFAHWQGWGAHFPIWTFPFVILAVDVAHVWSTIFRVYLDRGSFSERPLLYTTLPIVLWGIATALYAIDRMVFWRTLAYIAVWHFVRQQAGWLLLYRRRAPHQERTDTHIDTLAIYAATLYPLLWWHGHLPRSFTWFVDGDFFHIAMFSTLARWGFPVYVMIGLLFIGRQVQRSYKGMPLHWGKIVLVGSTWLCWWLGIIALNSDFAFTVTNVIIHGAPYFVLTYRFAAARKTHLAVPRSITLRRYRLIAMFAFTCLGLAFIEELLWDRTMWQEHAHLFGHASGDPGPGLLWVPLLTVPQATHYILDGLIWKSKINPSLRASMSG